MGQRNESHRQEEKSVFQSVITFVELLPVPQIAPKYKLYACKLFIFVI